MRKIVICLIIIAITFINVQSQNTDSIFSKFRNKYPFWSVLVPGATHFIDGNVGKGLAFSLSETALITGGLVFNHAIQRENTDAMNVPLLFGQQVYVMDKYDYLRKSLGLIKEFQPSFQYETASTKELMLAPFKLKNIFSGLCLGFIGYAVVDALISYHGTTSYKYKDISKVYFINQYVNRNDGTAYYGASAAMVSYGAGVSEEMLFRGYMLPLFDLRMGQGKGLALTTALFSAAHLPSYLQINNPYILLYGVTEITTLGYLMGRNVQNHNYHLGQAIAAHAWFDFTVMVTAWLMNPESNPLGFSLQFTID